MERRLQLVEETGQEDELAALHANVLSHSRISRPVPLVEVRHRTSVFDSLHSFRLLAIACLG